MDIMQYNKIMIVGSSGSGKSYVAKAISKITGYPLTHLDNEFWQPDWVKLPKAEWVEKQNQLVSKDQWIIDGNYDSTMEIRYKTSDLVILLDMNRIMCMYQAFKRHGTKRSDLPDYLDEKVDIEFIGFLKLIWLYKKTGRNKVLSLHKAYPNTPFIVLKNRRAIKSFLQSL
jgi:adenylate kinase family enzyme